MKLSHTDADLKELYERIKSQIDEMFKGRNDDSCRDSLAISAAASLLQISEFRCFQIAYTQWFGHELDERSMEHIFSSYLKQASVPHWVRHFTRKVFSLEDQGILNPEDFNIFRQQNTHRNRIRGICYSALILAVTIIFCIMIVT
jgi:hypothetical protein